MRDTPYATERKSVADALGQRIERLYIKEHAREEIRFSWWKDGNLMIRPLDLPEHELLPLMQLAIIEGVFTENFVYGLHSVLEMHLHRSAYHQHLSKLSYHDEKPVNSDGLIALLNRLPAIDEDWPEIDDPPPEPVEL